MTEDARRELLSRVPAAMRDALGYLYDYCSDDAHKLDKMLASYEMVTEQGQRALELATLRLQARRFREIESGEVPAVPSVRLLEAWFDYSLGDENL